MRLTRILTAIFLSSVIIFSLFSCSDANSSYTEEDLNEFALTLEELLASATASRDGQIDVLKSQYGEQIDPLYAANQVSQKELDALTAEYNAEVEKIKNQGGVPGAIEELTARYEASVSAINAKIAENSAKIAQLEAALKADIDRVTASFEKDISSMTAMIEELRTLSLSNSNRISELEIQLRILSAKLNHSFGEWVCNSDDTVPCEKRLYYRACTHCTLYEWKPGTAADHTFNVTTIPPTCTEEGYEKRHCTTCNKIETTTLSPINPDGHKWASEYSYNSVQHWFDCELCGKKGDVTAHTMIYDICDVCKHVGAPTPPDEDFYYYWEKTDLIFQLTLNTSGDELSSTDRRFLAGDLSPSDTAQSIDEEIAKRNAKALDASSVNVKYDYCDNTKAYGWGNNVDRIFTEVNSGATGVPDMYSNFAYDMTCISLKNAFANLLTHAYGKGMNFFDFTAKNYKGTSDDPFDPNGGNGYLYEYMKSLTLSDDRIYCIASNYTIDAIRALMVVPVNVEMMNTIALDKSTGDTGVMDGKFDISDFYNLVWAGGFTYDALATLSEAVYSPRSGYNPGADLGDVLGFAVDTTSILNAVGMLYSSDVQIIKKSSGGNGEFASSSDFEDFIDALTTLFGGSGICATTKKDAIGATGNTAPSALIAIRDQFTAGNNILFGGIVMLGSLEDSTYQEMMLDRGLGIAPVPIHKNAAANDKTPYNVIAHNLAHVVAISRNTTKFEQCSAFLNYQSMRSKDVIVEYFEDWVAPQTESDAAIYNNAKMLTYIRNNASGSVAKTCDDMINLYFGSSSIPNKSLHAAIRDDSFKLTNPTKVYDDAVDARRALLDMIFREWNKLPK